MTTILIIFCAAWIGAIIIAKRTGTSMIIGVGGGFLATLLIAVLLGRHLIAPTRTDGTSGAEVTDTHAFVACKARLRVVAGDATVPRVRDWGSGPTDHYYAWPNGAGLQIRDDDDQMRPATASCNHDGERITALSLNSTTIVNK